MIPRGAMCERRTRQACGGQGLVAALDSGRLSYAALDALWPEPRRRRSALVHPKSR
jgi:phosphoglycerate dehydrogenase-like enzyme